MASRDARLGWMIVIATLPLLLLGLPLKAVLEVLRQDDRLIALVIASTTIGFGLLLWYADIRGRRKLDEYAVNWVAALIIGCFQAIAIIPGTSRSGITMTAALFLGLTRHAASRFSFLLSIPTIVLAGMIATKDLTRNPRNRGLARALARRIAVVYRRLPDHPLLPALHRAHQHAALRALPVAARGGNFCVGVDVRGKWLATSAPPKFRDRWRDPRRRGSGLQPRCGLAGSTGASRLQIAPTERPVSVGAACSPMHLADTTSASRLQITLTSVAGLASDQ